MNDTFYELFPLEYDPIESTLQQLESLKDDDVFETSTLFVVLPEELETSVFCEVVIAIINGELRIGFPHFLDGHRWVDKKWSYDAYVKALHGQAAAHGVLCDYEEVLLNNDFPSDIVGVWIAYFYGVDLFSSVGDALRDAISRLKQLLREVEIILEGGPVWKTEYEKVEKSFSIEVLAPLLRRMNFLSVRYTHGQGEYGKDFTFSELTRFGNLRHYGLQAKAGNISGRVNSEIDEILGQIEDSFSMPYYELGSNEPRYISTLIVAISGHFTRNAREKIVEKMPRGVVGSVYFLDKETIIELLERYWPPRN